MTEDLMSGRLGELRDKRSMFFGSPREMLFQYLVITLGAAIFGLSITLFMVPYKIAPGGISGIVVVLNNLYGWWPGFLFLAFNIPIFLLGIKLLGTSFGLKSIYGTVMISVFTDLTGEILNLRMGINDVILAPVFGGVVMGVGLGLIIKMGGATSGSGTIARIIARYTNFTHGTAILIMNTTIIAVAGFVFRSADLAMYGLLSLWISSKVIDAIMEGMDYARGVFIFTEKVEPITDIILNHMDRSGTALKGRGLYTNHDREVIFCVLMRKEVPDLVYAIRKIDSRAFVVISQVYEVLGEGFRPRI
jgi:uncharacterized membrane-anchored protein YitT (DUF2179 family)